MKADIHPEIFPVIYRDANADADFFSYSTSSSEETEEHHGQTYHVIRIDVSSASHPFFTGKQNLVDTSGRVEKFKARLQKSQ